MEILISCATKIGEGLVESTGRQFGYFIYYNSYIDDLRKQLERLTNKKNDLKISIDEKERNGDIIREEVKKWVEDVDGLIENEASKLKEEEEKAKKNFRGWFPDLIRRRYRLGKEAKQKTMEVIKLQEVGDKFNTISTPAPPSAQLLMSSSNITIYKTTEDVMSEVMESLKNENINFIGIHGMGGVGKTTLVKEIQKNVTKEELFDKTVMVAISQNPDERNIQGQLADMLGVKLNEETVQGRASRLFDALMAVKKILIIFDDVWDTFAHFEDVGIPYGDHHKGCKVIITTRNKSVCKTLGSERWKLKMVPLYCLSDKESWDLFKKNAPVVTDPKLNKIAQEIIKKCGGLPLALVKAGCALRDRDLNDWEVAAQELKRSASMNIPGIDDSVVKRLELSYDKLKQEDAKHLFLLCSLFPEDFDISIGDLILYGFGLGIFVKYSTVQEARRITKSKIKYLEEVSLLLASGKEGCTKMHSFVRDVALSIQSGKYLVTADHVTLMNWPNMEQRVNNYRGVSLMKIEIEGPHPIFKCPDLQIMLLQENPIGGALRVLDMRSTGSDKFGTTQVYEIFHHFVLKVCDLKFLTTLILDGTQFMDTSFLGEIKTLQVLSLKDCIFHMELKGVSQLTELRFLDISHCLVTLLDPPMSDDDRPTLELRSFEISSSSSFSKLEELYLLSTVISPEFISCLKYMPCLKVLTISIPDFQQPLPREIFLPDHLETFIVSIGSNSYGVVFAPNSLCVLHNLFHGLQNLVHKLYKRTINTLTMGWCKGLKDIFPSLLPFDDGETTFQLKQLEVHKCDDFAYLIDNSKWVRKQRDPLLIFSNLNHLVLWRLNSFKGIICNFGWSVALHNLRILEISYCPILKTVLKPFVVSTLDNLEELSVEFCDALEEIVQSENGELESEMTVVQQQQDKMVFRSLKKLDLLDNNHLKAFSLIRSILEFPLLDNLSVRNCPNMKTFSFGIHSTPNLKEISLDDKRIHPEQGMMDLDLNMILQNHIKEKERKTENE